MGSFAFTVKVSDPDGALTGDPLRLQVSNTRNGITTPAGLYGTWDLGHISAGGENVTELQLLTPKDGKTYAIRLDSLAFARLYKIDVTGDYHPRPDAAAGVRPVKLGLFQRYGLNGLAAVIGQLQPEFVHQLQNINGGIAGHGGVQRRGGILQVAHAALEGDKAAGK